MKRRGLTLSLLLILLLAGVLVGLVIGVTLVALDDTWSAMRFRAPEDVGS